MTLNEYRDPYSSIRFLMGGKIYSGREGLRLWEEKRSIETMDHPRDLTEEEVIGFTQHS